MMISLYATCIAFAVFAANPSGAQGAMSTVQSRSLRGNGKGDKQTKGKNNVILDEVEFARSVHLDVFGAGHHGDELPIYSSTELREFPGQYIATNEQGVSFEIVVENIEVDSTEIFMEVSQDKDEDIAGWAANNDYECFFFVATMVGPTGNQRKVVANAATTNAMGEHYSITVQADPQELEVTQEDETRLLAENNFQDAAGCALDAIDFAKDELQCNEDGGELQVQLVDADCVQTLVENLDVDEEKAKADFDKAVKLAKDSFAAAKKANLRKRFIDIAKSLAKCGLLLAIPFFGGGAFARCTIKEAVKIISKQVVADKASKKIRDTAVKVAKEILDAAIILLCDVFLGNVAGCISCNA